MTDAAAAQPAIKVWDLFVRLFHWTVVIGFFVAYFTEGEPLLLHIWAGYVVCTAVVLRIVWGFIGTPHARFSDFVFPAKTVIAHALDEVRLSGKRYIGHNPAGGAMIIALLVMLLAVTSSGAVLLAIDKGQGPLSGVIARVEAPANAAVSADKGEDEHEHEPKSAAAEAAEEFHEIMVNLTLFLVIVHVAGVVVASLAHKENLVASMLHGRKRPLA